MFASSVNSHDNLVVHILNILFSGGTTLTFHGSNLNVTQSPMMQIIDPRFNSTQEVRAIYIHLHALPPVLHCDNFVHFCTYCP